MSKKTSLTPVISRPPDEPRPSISRRLRKAANPSWQRVGFSILLILGLLLLGSVGLVTWNWVRSLQITVGATAPQLPANAVPVQRTAPYAGLDFTVVSTQYATSFDDDAIHSGVGVVRLNMNVANKTTSNTSLSYYDAARLIVPQLAPVAPTNVHLSVGPAPGKSETGWLDFSVSKSVALNTLQLQLGSTQLNESLVTIPFSGAFNPNRYAGKTASQSLSFPYTYHGQFGLYLTYHLTGASRAFAYNGTQCKAGQEFYVLSFRVDNPNGVDIHPGFGYDYIRLMVGGSMRPPFDNTLPSNFKHGSKGVSGHVAFVGPAGMKSFSFLFLAQFGSGGDTYSVSL